jgi:hypothetical protein
VVELRLDEDVDVEIGTGVVLVSTDSRLVLGPRVVGTLVLVTGGGDVTPVDDVLDVTSDCAGEAEQKLTKGANSGSK